jgi:carbonic anhydrase
MTPGLSRRGMAGLLTGAAGLAVMPLAARGDDVKIEALGVTCIDYRLIDAGVAFFHKQGLQKEYDQVALAGASLAASSPKFPTSNAAFWDHVQIARQLHRISRVVFLDHRRCGAYEVAFGPNYAPDGAPELAQHRRVMEATETAMKQMHPDLKTEYWLMALDGSYDRVL